MNDKFDILIVGGGLVGASLVCALMPTISAFHPKVGLIEAYDIDEAGSTPPSYDARASALSYGTRLIYDNLGLWGELSSYATPICHVCVSDRGHFGATELNHKEEGVPALGYVVENHHLGDVLLQRLKAYREQQLVEVISPAEVLAITPLPDARSDVLVRTRGQESQLQSSLVVLADGGRSGLMEQLHIHRRQYDYKQHALIANVSLNEPHNGTAYERFAGDGPMALLPLSGDRAALVWTLPSDDASEKMAMPDDDFLSVLQTHFGYSAGAFINVGKRDAYPLVLSVAEEQVRPGLVILGNAAHAIHPVAGQGYNLAIRDAVALADNIANSFKQGVPPGNLTRLLDYVDLRQQDQRLTLDFCDNLVKLFSRQEKPVIIARNLGLVGLNCHRQLKSRFARKTMGL